MTKLEKVIEFLNKQSKGNNGEIYLGVDSYSKIPKVSKDEFINILKELQEKCFLKVKFKGDNSQNNSLCIIYPTSNLWNYFAIKKKKIHSNIKHCLWEFVKFFIPVIISVFALLKSYNIIN